MKYTLQNNQSFRIGMDKSHFRITKVTQKPIIM
jgi:hypothetical protein